ncbi:hypothetical protein PG991_012131 [Apiospora marii]|uniref:Uncharacterized protein n=1 Tax=Apiospora marii TaxID=335849 RepID=A0ABR1R8W0_9PEZI
MREGRRLPTEQRRKSAAIKRKGNGNCTGGKSSATGTWKQRWNNGSSMPKTPRRRWRGPVQRLQIQDPSADINAQHLKMARASVFPDPTHSIRSSMIVVADNRSPSKSRLSYKPKAIRRLQAQTHEGEAGLAMGEAICANSTFSRTRDKRTIIKQQQPDSSGGTRVETASVVLLRGYIRLSQPADHALGWKHGSREGVSRPRTDRPSRRPTGWRSTRPEA